jgi:hypothetical protein
MKLSGKRTENGQISGKSSHWADVTEGVNLSGYKTEIKAWAFIFVFYFYINLRS